MNVADANDSMKVFFFSSMFRCFRNFFVNRIYNHAFIKWHTLFLKKQELSERLQQTTIGYNFQIQIFSMQALAYSTDIIDLVRWIYDVVVINKDAIILIAVFDDV